MFVGFPHLSIYNPTGLGLNKMQLNAMNLTESFMRGNYEPAQPGRSKLGLDDNHSLGDNEFKKVTQVGNSVRRIRQAHDGITF